MLSNVWLSACTWASELFGDFYSRVALGSSTLIVWMGGLNWNMVFMVAGFLMGLATLLINWYYKHKNSKAFVEATKEASKRGYILNEPKE